MRQVMSELMCIPISSAQSSFKLRAELDDKEYVLQFSWNTRLGRWFVSLMDSVENPLIMGIMLVTNTPLFNRFRGEQYPQGTMILYNAAGQSYEAGRNDLGNTHYLVYKTYDKSR